MNWLFEFRVQPWDMDRYLEREILAIERGLEQLAAAKR